MRVRAFHVLLAASAAWSIAAVSPAQPAASAPQPGGQEVSPQDRAAAVKASLAASQAALRGYEWIETTTILLKGEEKSRTVKRCYYGADGKVQKIDTQAPPAEEPARGIRGRIKEKKKEELADYIKRAVEMVKGYVPPDPERIQAVKDAGKVSVQLLEPNKKAAVVFPDYRMPGDSLSVTMDIAANKLLGVSVSTYLDESVSAGEKPKDPVTLKVSESALPDGTWFPQNIELETPSKHLKVTVENSGHRSVSRQP